MPDQSRIPRKLSDFATYMENTAEYLLQQSPEPFDNLNWQRIAWRESEFNKWLSFADECKQLYPKYSDKVRTRTTIIKDKLLHLRKSVVRFNKKNKLLDRIVSNPENTTLTDYSTFHITRGTIMEKKRRKFIIAEIKEKVFLGIKSRGGGTFRILCFTLANRRRAHKPKDADIVLLEYKIGNNEREYVISSHASFVLNVGTHNTERVALIRARWYNSKHPGIAGPWCNWQRAVIG